MAARPPPPTVCNSPRPIAMHWTVPWSRCAMTAMPNPSSARQRKWWKRFMKPRFWRMPPWSPATATVRLTADRLDIWMGSQTALTNSLMAAELAGLKPEQVYFPPDVSGGGFGRRSNGDETAPGYPGGPGGQHHPAAAIAVVARTGYARRPFPPAISGAHEGRAFLRRQS